MRAGGALLVAAGASFLARPSLLANRFEPPGIATGFASAAPDLAFGIAVSLFVFGLAALACSSTSKSSGHVRTWPWLIASIASYIALCFPLAEWMIDDAAITFAYSENLVRGFGLRLHPSLPPEEGYSNTLWMLWLAALRALGVAIPAAAKVSCLALGVLTFVLVHMSIRKLRDSSLAATAGSDANLPIDDRSAAPFLVANAVLLGAPYLVWSASGLEHGLQALTMLIAAVAPQLSTWPRTVTAAALSALVLVRPEAPLIVATCFAVRVGHSIPGRGLLVATRSNLMVALVPAICWAGLIGFRLAYFGDPLPNPFYVKATDATFTRVLNLFGGGWGYVLSWAFGSGILVVLPIVVGACKRPIPLPIALGAAMSAAHLSFVLYAAGDWMGCWRFISPIIPMLAVIVGWAYLPERHFEGGPAKPGESRGGRRVVVALTLVVLALGTTKQYLAFASAPTTPYLVVKDIGERFVELGKRLGLNEPILAHHDAGGTSYGARIRLLDLGGLGNRTIAKHWKDADFISNYVLHEVAPDFVFGVAHNFAAGRSLFWQRPEFEENYVRVEFPGLPYMSSDLSHVKRALLDGKNLPPGIELVRNGQVISKVIVHFDAPGLGRPD